MKSLFLIVPFVFGFPLLPLAAQQQAQGGAGKPVPDAPAGAVHEAGLLLEYSLSERGKEITKSVLHADFQESSEGSKSGGGTVMMRLPGGVWSIVNTLQTGTKEEGQAQDDYLSVEISDLQKWNPPQGENNTMLPAIIFSVERRYHGPGTYVLFEDGERKMTLTVTEAKTAAVEKKK